MFVSRVDMRGGRRFQIRRGRMSMGFYLISFFGLVGRNRSVCFVGKKWPSWPSSWMILRLSFWSLLLKFHSPKEREKEWKREEAIDQPLTLSKLNKSSKVLSLSLSLSPVCLALLLPISWFPPWSCRVFCCCRRCNSHHRQRQHIGVRPIPPILCSGFYQLHCCRLLSLFTKR